MKNIFIMCLVFFSVCSYAEEEWSEKMNVTGDDLAECLNITINKQKFHFEKPMYAKFIIETKMPFCKVGEEQEILLKEPLSDIIVLYYFNEKARSNGNYSEFVFKIMDGKGDCIKSKNLCLSKFETAVDSNLAVVSVANYKYSLSKENVLYVLAVAPRNEKFSNHLEKIYKRTSQYLVLKVLFLNKGDSAR